VFQDFDPRKSAESAFIRVLFLNAKNHAPQHRGAWSGEGFRHY
jgi:hypothetical protein